MELWNSDLSGGRKFPPNLVQKSSLWFATEKSPTYFVIRDLHSLKRNVIKQPTYSCLQSLSNFTHLQTFIRTTPYHSFDYILGILSNVFFFIKYSISLSDLLTLPEILSWCRIMIRRFMTWNIRKSIPVGFLLRVMLLITDLLIPRSSLCATVRLMQMYPYSSGRLCWLWGNRDHSRPWRYFPVL